MIEELRLLMELTRAATALLRGDLLRLGCRPPATKRPDRVPPSQQ
jgi:hypothetical protein